jgi:hypothetical protein
LETPAGVCADNAILMTALLRAEGIPARMISGLALNMPLGRSGDWRHPGSSHAWVEFYVDGQWHFADPTWDLFNQNGPDRLSYGTYESNVASDFQQTRLDAIKSDGFSVVASMSAPFRFIVYSTDENTMTIPRTDVSFSWLG